MWMGWENHGLQSGGAKQRGDVERERMIGRQGWWKRGKGVQESKTRNQ